MTGTEVGIFEEGTGKMAGTIICRTVILTDEKDAENFANALKKGEEKSSAKME